jgi:hypothetical protein
MAKKKAAKPSKTAAADPNAPDAPAQSSVDPNNPQSNAVGAGLGEPSSSPSIFTGWISDIEADFLNVLNQSFNTIFFGLALMVGGGMVLWGGYLLFKDSAPAQGAKSVAKTALGVAAVVK